MFQPRHWGILSQGHSAAPRVAVDVQNDLGVVGDPNHQGGTRDSMGVLQLWPKLYQL